MPVPQQNLGWTTEGLLVAEAQVAAGSYTWAHAHMPFVEDGA